MTYGELKAALIAGGFSMLGDPEVARHVQGAVRELTTEELWHWRARTAVVPVDADGGGFHAIRHLGPVRAVYDSTGRVLEPISLDERAQGAKWMTQDGSGEARFYYVGGADSDNVAQVTTMPGQASQITVIHYSSESWTQGADGDGDGIYAQDRNEPFGDDDVPRCPPTWHDLIVLLARVRAGEESPSYELAGKAWERYQARLEQMRTECMSGADEPQVIALNEGY